MRQYHFKGGLNLIAAIVKHLYRDNDYRVDLFDDSKTFEEIKEHYDRNMLGPFEVVSITSRVSTSKVSTILREG